MVVIWVGVGLIIGFALVRVFFSILQFFYWGSELLTDLGKKYFFLFSFV